MEANENSGERKIKRFKVRERERGGSHFFLARPPLVVRTHRTEGLEQASLILGRIPFIVILIMIQ